MKSEAWMHQLTTPSDPTETADLGGTGARLLLRAAGRFADSRWAPALVGAGYPVLRSLLGESMAERLRQLPVKLAGWPFERLGFIDNMHSFGLKMRIDQRLSRFPLRAKRPPRRHGGPLRVGLVGEVSIDGGKPVTLATQFPEEHQLFLFDIARDGEHGPLPKRPNVTVSLHDLNHDYDRAMRELCANINDAGLDLLILANYRFEEKNDIAQLVDTPCLVHFVIGIQVLSHPKVDFVLYPLVTEGYHIHGGRLFSDFTGRFMPTERLVPGCPVYNDLNVAPADNPPWEERAPVIVAHGRLVKFNYPPFLEMMLSLLEAEGSVRFAMLGPGDELTDIRQAFERRGLGARVEYHGFLDAALDKIPENRQRVLEFLRRGRLSPNTWPQTGGRTRTEAYMAGTPTVHMRYLRGREGDDSRRLIALDLPWADIPSGVAGDLAEYKEMSLKCLFDREFANKIIGEQYVQGRRMTDARRWWSETLANYSDWLCGTGWATDQDPAATDARGKTGEAT